MPKAATGARFATVTVCDTLFVAPSSSVTCRRTVYVPALANVFETLAVVPSSNAPSLSRSQACDAMKPSGSTEVEVNATESAVVGDAGVEPKAAVGARFETVTVFDTAFVPPSLSVTCKRTVYVPDLATVLDAVLDVPSSKAPSLSRSHACDAIVPSGSVEVELKLTAEPLTGAAGVTVNEATGERFATVMVLLATLVAPRSSVTCSRTV